jgi:hypothetical protein
MLGTFRFSSRRQLLEGLHRLYGLWHRCGRFERPAKRCIADLGSDLGALSTGSLPITARLLFFLVPDRVLFRCFAAREFGGPGAGANEMRLVAIHFGKAGRALGQQAGQRFEYSDYTLKTRIAGVAKWQTHRT